MDDTRRVVWVTEADCTAADDACEGAVRIEAEPKNRTEAATRIVIVCLIRMITFWIHNGEMGLILRLLGERELKPNNFAPADFLLLKLLNFLAPLPILIFKEDDERIGDLVISSLNGRAHCVAVGLGVKVNDWHNGMSKRYNENEIVIFLFCFVKDGMVLIIVAQVEPQY